MKIYFVGIILVLSAFLLGCTVTPANNTVNDLNAGFFGKLVDVNQSYSVSGLVTDESFNAVSDVEVYFGNIKTVSDKQGNYFFNTNLGGKAIISFVKEGFVPIHKSVVLGESNLTLDTVLFKETSFVRVDLSKDINAEMNGAALRVSANSFVVKGTDIKATDAQVSLTSFDPTDDVDVQAFPGEFEGELKTGEVTAIESFGFAKVQVENSVGEKLDLAKGKEATLKIPISANQIQSSPETIPLWYFDEMKGTWVEKGIAKKICNANECYYEGQIDTIASWWNCDKTILDSGVAKFKALFSGKLFACLSNPKACISDWVKGKFDAVKKWGTGLWNDMKNGVKSAFDKAKQLYSDFKNRDKINAQKMVETAKNIINSEDYTGKFELISDSDGKINLKYTGELNTLGDLANCAKDLETLFPTASAKEIFRMMRNSTTYGEFKGEGQRVDLATSYLFKGGELQHLVRLTNPDGGLFVSSHGSNLTNNGVSFDAAHFIVGIDSVYNPILNALSHVPGGYSNISEYQSLVDVAEASWFRSLGASNPADIRGNNLGAYATQIRGNLASEIITGAQEGFNEATRSVDLYENLIYNPIHNGTSVSGIPVKQVLSDSAQVSLNNFLSRVKSGSVFESSNLIQKEKKISFAGSDNLKSEFGVNVKTGEISVEVLPGLISYSQFGNNRKNSFAQPFSVSAKEDSNYLYSDGKLGYIVETKDRGVFFNYESNILKNIFLISDENYYGKYDFEYTNGLLSSINFSFASSIGLGSSKKMKYDSLKRLIEINEGVFTQTIDYDNADRVVLQKFSNSGNIVYSVKYDYEPNKTSVSEYYKDFEILLKTTTYSIEGDKVTTNLEENISLEELLYVEASELSSSIIALNDLINAGSGSITATLKGVDYSASSKINVDFLNNDSFSLKGAPGQKAILTFENTKKLIFEPIQIDLPQAGQSKDFVLNYSYAIIPIKITGSAKDGELIKVKINSKTNVIQVNTDDVIVALIKPNKEKEVTFIYGGDVKTLKVEPLLSGEAIITETIEFERVKELYKVFDCKGHYAYVKSDANKDNQEIYFDGVKIDETLLTQDLVIFDNHIAYSKHAYFDSDGNLCGYDYNKLCDYEQYVVYDGKIMGKGEHPSLWGNHIGYCDGDNKFVYDGTIFSDSYCLNGESSSGYPDFLISHNNFAYTTEDGSVIWNGKKITDSNDSPRHIVWMDGNNLLTQKANQNANSDDYYIIFENGEIFQKASLYNTNFTSSIGTIWGKIEKAIFKDKFQLDKIDESSFYSFFGDNYLVYNNNNENLIFNDYFTQFKFDELTSPFSLSLFDNHYAVPTLNGFFVDEIKVSDVVIDSVRLFEDNWAGFEEKDDRNAYNFYFNGKYVGESKSKSAVLFKDHYAFVSKEGLVYDGNLVSTKDTFVSSTAFGVDELILFGDHIYWEEKVDTNKGYYDNYFVDGNLIGTSKEITNRRDMIFWPGLNLDWGAQEDIAYYPINHDFLQAWDYCMKYPSEISE